MIRLYDGGVYLCNGETIVPDGEDSFRNILESGCLKRACPDCDPGALSPEALREAAKDGTMAWQILRDHNHSGSREKLQIRFDKLTSHDITFVGIIQTARASGLERFPIPYVLTNCHNSLCAVGGTINEDDHLFGLSCAKHYGGVYVPPHQAVIHQFAREMMAESGGMILGSDSHTRYGALGTMAVGEGGPELVKQLLRQTWDIDRPQVVAVYLTGKPQKGVGPQDVALAIIGAVFKNGYVNNKVMEFVGPGVKSLSADFRIGVDVMTTETTCLSSIWQTDETIREFYEIHGRKEAYRELAPAAAAWYDGCIYVDLDSVEPMIAMPFHPSNAYPIREVKENLEDILALTEERARVSFGDSVPYSLRDKIHNGKLYTDQGIIAGCAGGGFENICDAADILRGKNIGADVFTLSIYPASMPIYRELAVNGRLADLVESGAVIKTAFCGPCFGAGDTPANNAFSIRHSTRNFPNREGSKIQNGQIASVALMDARSIAATAAARGYLTAATELADLEFTGPAYHFDSNIYANRVFDSKGKADPDEPIRLGPNIRDWPQMSALPENLVLKIVSEIHDPVTTTDELIPSGETSSYRSNPLGLAEFTLSRKDPAYVGLAKEVQGAQKAIEEGKVPVGILPELAPVLEAIGQKDPQILQYRKPGRGGTGERSAGAASETADGSVRILGIGSAVYAVKPGDGSAREQAASCQKVLGGWANIAGEYATKRYRSNLINWGMLPLLSRDQQLPFSKGDYLFLPGIREAVANGMQEIEAYVVRGISLKKIQLFMGDLTEDERQIILDGCLINFNRRKALL